MNDQDMLNNKGQTLSHSELVSEKKEEKAYSGNFDLQAAGLTDEMQVTAADLPSIEQLEFEIKTEDVCQGDNRIRISDTTAYPWRTICRLLITRADGKVAVGSGWLNGAGSVITAGHCVYSKDLKKWHKSIVVIPGKNYRTAPYGQFTSSEFWSVSGWINNLDPDYDYGAILLADKIGKRIGYFGFRSDSDSEIRNKSIINSGYPADKSGTEIDTQWHMKGKIESERLTERKVYYMLDTYGGNSGCPVWPDDGNYQAIGIHAYGGCPNSATRINRAVFSNLLQWKKIGERIAADVVLTT